jgi:hypothetical protein
MKRVMDLLLGAAGAAAFVACVEFFVRRSGGGKNRIEPRVAPSTARLRVRHAHTRARVTFSIEGDLDELAARLLACSVAQAPPSATAILDLRAAGPIRGKALAVLARLFAARREIRLHGADHRHAGLLAVPRAYAAA